MAAIEARHRRFALVAAAVLLSACAVPPPHTGDGARALSGAAALATRWRAETGQALALDVARSRVDIRVWRDGRLAHLGHNHVLEVSALRGRLSRLQRGGGLADLALRVDRLRVDDAAARARAGAGFERMPDERAVAGTRRNMLGAAVLDAQRWPEVRVLARVADLSGAQAQAEILLSVRGVDRLYRVPTSIEATADGIRLSGSMVVRQSDFGITPFAVFGGALRVRDDIQADFVVVGRTPDGVM